MNKTVFCLVPLWAAFIIAASGTARAEGDAAAGKKLFARCVACHAATPGKHGIGPSLFGVFGRKAGTVAGYGYSSAMKKAAPVWNAVTLDRHLDNPPRFIPGTRQTFRLPDAGDRANVIAYLATLK
jgi:cytochrome c